MWLPHRLYESLPLLYVATAALCLLTLGISFGTALGAVALSAAAMTTWKLRRQARSSVSSRTRHRVRSRAVR